MLTTKVFIKQASLQLKIDLYYAPQLLVQRASVIILSLSLCERLFRVVVRGNNNAKSQLHTARLDKTRRYATVADVASLFLRGLELALQSAGGKRCLH